MEVNQGRPCLIGIFYNCCFSCTPSVLLKTFKSQIVWKVSSYLFRYFSKKKCIATFTAFRNLILAESFHAILTEIDRVNILAKMTFLERGDFILVLRWNFQLIRIDHFTCSAQQNWSELKTWLVEILTSSWSMGGGGEAKDMRLIWFTETLVWQNCNIFILYFASY